jgi:hypothetical protein
MSEQVITNKPLIIMNSIFTFDHGQKKFNAAIGVDESYLDDLAEQMSKITKDFLFNKDKTPKDDTSPSKLVEVILNEFSYSQLVIIASFFMKDKMDILMKKLSEEADSAIKKVISLNADDLPQEMQDFLEKLARESDEEEE